MIRSALIVGGGVGGMSAALSLRRRGVTVHLIDADPQWRVYGAGISLTGLSLRAFDDLGVLEQIREQGFIGSGFRGRSSAGHLLFDAPQPPNPKPIQQSGGILRPVLHRILSSAVREAGTKVTLGLTVETLSQDATGVAVRFSDGSQEHHDLLIGADGIHSQVRRLAFPDAPAPTLNGQGCWRVVADRPATIDRTEMYLGGPVKLGLNPVSRSQMYVFVLEAAPAGRFVEPKQLAPHLRELLAPFGGDIPAVRAAISTPDQVNYRPLEWILLREPWFNGRVVLIGDAAHATTPHLASGAGLAAEDGLVLGEVLECHDDLDTALHAFMTRRFERVRQVVEHSVRIGDLELAGDRLDQASTLAGATLAALAAPY